MTIYPVFVPSKGRAEKLLTVNLLGDVPHSVVVEPQEYAAYVKHMPEANVICVDENDRGLAYVRNYILDMGRERGGWFWMLDDDISGFYRVEARRNVRTPAGVALGAAQEILEGHPAVVQGSLEYQQYSWSARKAYVLNGYCDVCVCIDADRASMLYFREEMDLKLDRDFTLQVLSMGYDTLRTSKVAFASPKNGSNTGGLHSAYAQEGREEAVSRHMTSEWGGDVCQFRKKKDGRPDVKINWGHFRRTPERIQ